MIDLPDWLTHRAATTPAHPALVAGGRSWTYAELDADVERTALGLLALGVAAGDRVATLLPNGPAPALLVHAVLRAGATLVPLNIRLRAEEIAWQIGDSAPRLVVVDARTAPLVTEMGDATQVVTLEALWGDAAKGSGLHSPGDADAGADAYTLHRGGPPAPAAAALRRVHPADHVLAIIYTSGTTGRPKGAMLTVGNFWWSATGSALNLGTHAADRWLAVLPLFHVGGLSILLRAAIYGITAIVHDTFDETAVARAIVEERVTIVSVVAVMLQRLLDARGDAPWPATLRCVLLGGGPAPRPLLDRCAAVGVPVVQTYGLTESTSQVATLSPDDALRKLGSAGRALYPNEVRIAAPRGGEGEILVRGPIVMAGYAGRAEETAQAIVDGWLHTGDVGRVDDEGFLYVLDRRDDLIITGGENVYPAEVEAALLAHPSVVEAGVIGVAGARWGQRVVAIVRATPDADVATLADTLRTHCRARLAGYKVPSEVRLVSEPLPRTASGKLRRAALRALISEQGGVER